MQRKLLALVLSAVLGVVVFAGVWKSLKHPPTASAPPIAAPAACSPVTLLTGSAKFAFLQDPRVAAVLNRQGLCLTLTKSGNFQEDAEKAATFDAVWPAGANAANDFTQVLKRQGEVSSYPVFSTPLALASWKPLLPVLEQNGLVQAQGPAPVFLLEKALPMMLAGKRWNQLDDNSVFAVNKGLLVNTPDIRKSNTGLLYIALLAWLKNGSEVPTRADAAEALARELTPLITRQGFQEGTLAGPFEDYIGQGMGKAPLVLVYESQFAEARQQGKLRDKHVLLYPRPGLLLKHVLIARTANGKRLGTLLATDATLQRLAAEYGFRTNDPKVFEQAMARIKLPAPELLELGDIPETQLLDLMQKTIVSQFN